MLKRLKCFDICCGAGIFSLGFQKAGFEILGGIDIDNDAINTAGMNDGTGQWEQLPIEKLRANLEDRNVHIIRKTEVILAGLPCQGFSNAGTRNPSDKRNSLYKHLLAITAIVKPKYVVIENVRGILAERNAKTYSRIIKGLENQGYKVDYRLYNAANLGTPQTRYRVIIFASQDVEPRFVFDSIRFSKKHKTVKDALTGLPRTKEVKSINHTFMEHSNEVERKIARIKDAKIISYRRLQLNKPSLTIISGHNALPLHPTEHRAISNREAARIQGIPDTFIFSGSRTSQTIQVANAVPFNMAKSLAEAIKRSKVLQQKSRGHLFKVLENKISKTTKEEIKKGLVQFYKKEKRDYPWRKVTDPYKILISEMLLQRTKSDTVSKYWSALISRINPLKNGKDFKLSSVRPFFKILGIFNRAGAIKKLNKALYQYYGNKIPQNFDELMQLPGVGIYMASAVRTFAYGIPDFPVDSNGFRFIQRFFGEKITGKKSEARQIREFMNKIIDPKKPKEFVYGFLDFCSIVCKPINPDCSRCFLRNRCVHGKIF